MSRPILAPFLTFHKEAVIIGRLLAGYTTLEVGLMHCVQVVRDDFDAVLKAMFRPWGETSRIDIADALGRQSGRHERNTLARCGALNLQGSDKLTPLGRCVGNCEGISARHQLPVKFSLVI
jgi:hypothetical protein